MTTTNPGQGQASVMDRAICLVISFNGIGLTRKASMGGVTVNAEKAMLALSKRLLKSAEFDAIKALDREVKQYLKEIALPSPMKAGTYLVPIPMVEEVEQRLLGWRDDRAERVDAFIAAYPEQRDAVQSELRDLYDPRDYPSTADLLAKFSMEWQYVDFGTPGRLKAISATLFEREREKAAAKLTEATDDIRHLLREGFAELVGKMAESLKPAEDGKRRILKQATIDNLTRFMQLFELRNIADDDDLAALVQQARELIGGNDQKTIKSDEQLKQRIADGFGEMAASLETLTESRGRRAISLDDDDA